MALRTLIAALGVATSMLAAPAVGEDLRTYMPRVQTATFEPGPANACVSASAAALASLGYGVWKPSGAVVWARHPTEKISVGVLCDSGYVIVAEGGEYYGSAKREAELKRVLPTVQDVVAGRARVPAVAAWTTAPAAVNVNYSVLPKDAWGVDCGTLAHRTGEALGYHSTTPSGKPAGDGWIEQDAPWFNVSFSCPAPGAAMERGVLLVGVSVPSVPLDRAGAMQRVTETAMAQLPGAQPAPRLEVDEMRYVGDARACLTRAAEALSGQGFELFKGDGASLYGRMAGYGPDGPVVGVACAPGGQALIAFSEHPANSDSSYDLRHAVSDALAAPQPTGAAINWATASERPRLRLDLRTSGVQGSDCREGATAAVGAAAGPSPTSSTLRSGGWISYGSGNAGAMGAVYCGEGWLGGVLTEAPRAPVDPEAGVQALISATLAEADKPQWHYAGTNGFTVQTPRSSTAKWVDSPAGRRYDVVSTFKGATYAAFKLTPAAKADDDALLNAQLDRLRAEGATIVSSKASFFQGNSSIVVWSSRTSPSGALIKSTARYVVRRGLVYGIEVTYPEALDVADTMKTFSERFSVYGS